MPAMWLSGETSASVAHFGLASEIEQLLKHGPDSLCSRVISHEALSANVSKLYDCRPFNAACRSSCGFDPATLSRCFLRRCLRVTCPRAHQGRHSGDHGNSTH